jgi:peptidoglycan/xylan/chitin deacetylase (PgdA/CDA1 family)
MRWVRRFCCAALAFCTVLSLCGVSVRAQARIIYRYASKTGPARVALTFDDGPHPKYTPMVLDILAEYGVKATFFTVGSNAEAYPALIERICREGHELGNHTHSHDHVAKMSRERLDGDVRRCSETIRAITGAKPRYFRPPEGVCNEYVREICDAEGMSIVLWSVDTRDWAHTGVEEICRNVRHNTTNGSIILMHDFIGKNSPTPEALRQIVPMLLESGYAFVTVTQLLEE